MGNSDPGTLAAEDACEDGLDTPAGNRGVMGAPCTRQHSPAECEICVGEICGEICGEMCGYSQRPGVGRWRGVDEARGGGDASCFFTPPVEGGPEAGAKGGPQEASRPPVDGGPEDGAEGGSEDGAVLRGRCAGGDASCSPR